MARTLRSFLMPACALEGCVDIGFVLFVGTMLFFAALHQWPPDGRRWQRQELDQPAPADEPAAVAPDRTRASR